MIVPIEHLAIHAVEALVGVDLAVGMNGLDHALFGAALAGAGALFVPAQPLKNPQLAGNGQGRAPTGRG